MPEYLAIISGTAVEYGFGGNMPYDFHEAIRFNVENESLAQVEAKKTFIRIEKRIIMPGTFFKIS